MMGILVIPLKTLFDFDKYINQPKNSTKIDWTKNSWSYSFSRTEVGRRSNPQNLFLSLVILDQLPS